MLSESFIKNSVEKGLRYLKEIADQLVLANSLKQKEMKMSEKSEDTNNYVPRD